ncbi:MAG: hypothetical protein IT243_04365 [Bacteroidia bacterium]|nr:hypothetical protein [Bacteroidia bacterium]
MDFTLEHNILKKLGVIGIFRSQANAVNAGEYAQDLANYLGADNPEETTSVSVESSPYSLGGIMTGLYGSFPIVNKFSFEPHALVGFSVATLPASTTKTYESNTKLTTFIWEQSATFAFSYIIGTKAKLDISKRICVLFNIDYYAAKAEWDNVQEVGIGHITNNTKIYMYDYSQKFSTINLIAGLGFKF